MAKGVRAGFQRAVRSLGGRPFGPCTADLVVARRHAAANRVLFDDHFGARVRQRVAEGGPGRDADLGEDPVEVGADGAM